MTILITGAILSIVVAALFLAPTKVSAHCDTMDGPTAIDGKKALETGNINYAFKWIFPEHENELKEIFEKTLKVRKLGKDAQELADRYFLENLVRLHRAGEGAPFIGLKPSGISIDEKIAAADKSIEVGNLTPLKGVLSDEEIHALEGKFKKAMSLIDYDVNDLSAAREYVEAYVSFFKMAEGEDHDHGHHEQNHEHGHSH